MPADNPTLPGWAVNRGFMAEFVAADPPCFALGLVKVEGARRALVALRPGRAIPERVTAGGFGFGHALPGGDGREVVQFGFEFYGFAACSARCGPTSNMARIRRSTTSEAQYRAAASRVRERPEPPGTLLEWVCRGNAGHLDPERDRLVPRPA